MYFWVYVNGVREHHAIWATSHADAVRYVAKWKQQQNTTYTAKLAVYLTLKTWLEDTWFFAKQRARRMF